MLAVASNYSIPVFPEKRPIILSTVANYSSVFTNYSPIILKKLRTQSNSEAAVNETEKYVQRLNNNNNTTGTMHRNCHSNLISMIILEH